MDCLRTCVARICGRLPGTVGLAGYYVCCLLPCKVCKRRPAGRASEDGLLKEGTLPSIGTRRVVVLGLDGAGKSSFLWMCDNPLAKGLSDRDPSAAPAPSAGVVRLTRKDVALRERGVSADVDISEIGGGPQVRRFWQHYLTKDVDAVAFFVDASAPARLEEAAAQLASLSGAICSRSSRASSAVVAVVVTNVGAAGSLAPAEVHRRFAACVRGSSGGAGAAVAAVADRLQCLELLELGQPGARGSSDALFAALADLAAD